MAGRNHFPKDNTFVINLVSDYDIFETEVTHDGELFRSWLVTRLWVVAAKNESEMIERAKLVLQKDLNHTVRIDQLLDLKELLK
jgi:hypothetical protein